MRAKQGELVRIIHILDAIGEIESYISSTNEAGFLRNSMMRFACIKQMEVIGEACNHLTEDLRATYAEIQWGQTIGMRNVFVHEYFGVDIRLVWDIIVFNLPPLKGKLLTIKNALSNE
ncbi:MAG: DUF86 domain-containing protein [Bacteroidia bacterium]